MRARFLIIAFALALAGVVYGCASTHDNEAEDTDPVDRLFAPLDNAVDDINRDLNEGSDDDDDEKAAKP